MKKLFVSLFIGITFFSISTATEVGQLLKEIIRLGEKVSDHRNVSLSAWEHTFGPSIIIGSSSGFQTICNNMPLADRITVATCASMGFTLTSTPLLSTLVIKYKMWRIKKAIERVEHCISETKSITQLKAACELLQSYLTVLLFNEGMWKDPKAFIYCYTIIENVHKKIENQVVLIQNFRLQ